MRNSRITLHKAVFNQMETIILTAWGTTLCLVALFCIDAVCFAITRATREVTGLYPDQAAVKVATTVVAIVKATASHVWVWGICNPTWAWNGLDAVEAAMGKKPQGSQQYLKF